jgi:hypothetical protein
VIDGLLLKIYFLKAQKAASGLSQQSMTVAKMQNPFYFDQISPKIWKESIPEKGGENSLFSVLVVQLGVYTLQLHSHSNYS